jgi:hypothetical protein
MTIQRRLQVCMKRGNLLVADLARWFDRPHPTVRGWVLKGTRPGGGPHDIEHVNELLGLLETLIRKKKGFPLPRLSPRGRKKHIADIRVQLFTPR